MIGVTMSEQDGSEATEIQVELIQLAGHAGGIVFQAAVDKDEAVRGGHGVGRRASDDQGGIHRDQPPSDG